VQAVKKPVFSRNSPTRNIERSPNFFVVLEIYAIYRIDLEKELHSDNNQYFLGVHSDSVVTGFQIMPLSIMAL